MPTVDAAPRAFARKPPSRQTQSEPDQHEAMMQSLRDIQRTLEQISTTLEAFACTLVNAKFPYGKATDRFSQRKYRA